MIGSLRGKVVYKDLSKVEVDTNGIGWEVFVPKNDLAKIVENDQVELFVFHQVSEKINCFFGFLDRKNKRVFEMLISVSGVGPKTAVEIFSDSSGEKIIKAIAEADVDFFNQIKGIGKKGAQRIIVDLKNKVGSIKEIDLERQERANEVVYQALSSLGFRKDEIKNALDQLPDEIIDDDHKIKSILKIIGKNGQKKT